MARVIVLGGGDLASAVIHKLHRSGFEVIVLERNTPTVVRRTVAFANAVYEGSWEVEGVASRLAESFDEARMLVGEGIIPVMLTGLEEALRQLRPDALIDCTLSKRSPSYTKEIAPVVIALGPEYTAGVHVHAVIETARGHDLGRIILQGKAKDNTHTPGNIGGYTHERVLRSPAEGRLKTDRKIGDLVKKGDVIGTVSGEAVISQIDGIIRGLVHGDVVLRKGMKTGDVDPRGIEEYCYTISDKGRNIAGSVLEAVLMLGKANVLLEKDFKVHKG